MPAVAACRSVFYAQNNTTFLGGRIRMALLIIFNIIIVIIAICFGVILWRAANAKRTDHKGSNGVQNSISKESMNKLT
jgi:uncharacterized membrane protein